MFDVKKMLSNQYRLTNIIIGLIGAMMVLSAVIIKEKEVLYTVLLSVGSSMIATSIATWLTSYYIINNNEIKEIITAWKLKAMFRTKSEMNMSSNKCLDTAKEYIDIIAIGMANFLSSKGNVLEKKAIDGVQIRIISCNNLEMLEQREKDETVGGGGKVIDVMKNEVIALSEWVQRVNNQGGKISIKYHSTYPGFSYLRIDDSLFFGPNLPLYKSQTNFALEFDINGEGGRYFEKYFDSLWTNSNLCSDKLNF